MRYSIETTVNDRYVQMPTEVMYGESYKGLSINAKFVYCLLRDRLGFAKDNGWIEKNGDLYVYYSAESLADRINQSSRNLRRIFNELKNYGLIEIEKDGKLNKFYIHKPEETATKSVQNSGQNLQKQRTNLSKIADTDVPYENNSGQICPEQRTNLVEIADKSVQNSGHGCPPIKTNNIKTNNKTNNNNINTLSCPTDTQSIERVQTQKRKRDDTPYQEVVGIFNEVCTDLPQVRQITDQRKKAIKARFNELDRDTNKIRQLFQNVHESDFLSGRKEGTNWRACFDWILKPANTAKILEGNYKNRESKGVSEYDKYDYSEYEEYERNQKMPWES